MNKIKPSKKRLTKERILSMRMIGFAYRKGEEFGRGCRNTNLNAIEFNVRNAFMGCDGWKSIDAYVRYWLPSVFRLGLSKDERERLIEPLTKEFVKENRFLIAEIELGGGVQ